MWQAKKQKYHAQKIVIDGIDFPSKKEARRWMELLLLQKAGEIEGLRRQVRFELIPAQYAPDITTATGKKKRGACLERKCDYIADFVYSDLRTGEYVVEDAKGMKTEVYKIKRKLMLYIHGIRVKEV